MTAIMRFEMPDELLNEREVVREIRNQFREIGDTWHREHRKRHFSHFGAQLYRYEPRKRAYNRRKRKKFGHTLPLVFTGVSRKLSESYRLRVNNAPNFGVNIVMPVRVFNFTPRNSQVNMRAEFSAIAQSEVDQYASKAVRGIEAAIDRLPAGRTITVS